LYNLARGYPLTIPKAGRHVYFEEGEFTVRGARIILRRMLGFSSPDRTTYFMHSIIFNSNSAGPPDARFSSSHVHRLSGTRDAVTVRRNGRIVVVFKKTQLQRLPGMNFSWFVGPAKMPRPEGG
jgi:hypothetical protein